MFNDIQLKFSDNVSHLGHLLSYNLNDNIIRVVKALNLKAITLFSAHFLLWIHLSRLISSLSLSMVAYYGHCRLPH